jgi:hypothetical protein
MYQHCLESVPLSGFITGNPGTGLLAPLVKMIGPEIFSKIFRQECIILGVPCCLALMGKI